MPGLQFQFVEFIDEIRVFQAISAAYVDPISARVLDEMRSNMETLASMREGVSRNLNLRELRTRWFRIRSGQTIQASITGVWEITPIGDHSQKHYPHRLFEYSGKASTKIELHQQDNPERMAMWRTELGSQGSPGHYFHIQVLGDKCVLPFPSSMQIPRFPSIFVTPLTAIEFVLGEIFQEKWDQEVMKSDSDHNTWRQLQKRRLENLFRSYEDVVKNTLSSPWMALKSNAPDEKLFLD